MLKHSLRILKLNLRGIHHQRLLAIREQLHKLIQSVLLGLEPKIHNPARRSEDKIPPGEYHLLYSKLEPQDTIVTFNWDILLDNVLEREQILDGDKGFATKDINAPRPNQYRHFFNELSAKAEMSWKHIVFDQPYQEWKPESGYYLKVHGSIDWFYCSNDQCRASRKVFPLLEPSKQHYCAECHEPLVLLIIPPVINKTYRQHPLVRKIWNVAAKEFSIVEELVVWGYSLPTTDFYATWLFRQARQSSLKTITIIDPSAITKEYHLSLSFLRKFYDIFRDLIPKESVHIYESFEDYCGNENVFAKHEIESNEIMKT